MHGATATTCCTAAPLCYLWVGNGPDGIKVRSRAESSSSTLNDEAFPVRPALQLADLLLQLHHHAAWDEGQAQNGAPVPSEETMMDSPEKAFMRDGLLTVSTATPDSCLSRSMEPPGKACSFSLISSWLKLWTLELHLCSSLGGTFRISIKIKRKYAEFKKWASTDTLQTSPPIVPPAVF